MEQALRLVPSLLPAHSCPSVTELELCALPYSRVHHPTPVLEEGRAVEVRGVGSMLQALIDLTSGDQVSALRPASSILAVPASAVCL